VCLLEQVEGTCSTFNHYVQYSQHEIDIFLSSGLIMKPNIARKASKLLLQYQDMPPDIILQKCLLGELEECQECSNNLVSSKRLLMHHIGYNASTSDERSYKKNEFQCGWRHPFVSLQPLIDTKLPISNPLNSRRTAILVSLYCNRINHVY
jgi:hypothetical protein